MARQAHAEQRISIHAPVKGATGLMDRDIAESLDFNPRSREGSDNTCTSTPLLHDNFNPRSREGSDCSMIHPMTNI